MRTWTRTTAMETICGGPCVRRLARGTPVLHIQLEGSTTKRIRCEQCAGEPVPADMPPFVESLKRAITPTPIVREKPQLPFSRFQVPADFKMAAAGREPGSDDE